MRSPIHFLALLLCAVSSAAAQSPSPAAKETVKFDGQTLAIASNESDDKESLKEYLPDGENFNAWTKLASVHVFKKLSNPIGAAMALETELEQGNSHDLGRMIKDPKTGEAVLDFVVTPRNKSFVEWNVMKYTKNADGQVVLDQYALRAYGDKIADFLTRLKTERTRLVDLMAKDGLAVSQ